MRRVDIRGRLKKTEPVSVDTPLPQGKANLYKKSKAERIEEQEAAGHAVSIVCPVCYSLRMQPVRVRHLRSGGRSVQWACQEPGCNGTYMQVASVPD